MKRPKTFEDIKGHPWLVTYLKEHIINGTLKHFLIIEGPEGLGKTSLADLIALSIVYGLKDSDEREEAYNNVVVTGRSNDYIRRFKCSVEGGKDVAKEIKDEMNTTFTLDKPKVIICDECHGLTEQAQDVFLSETEFISDKVYVIMLTTEVNKLKASLRSRAVSLHVNPLKQQDMVDLLRREVESKRLVLQNQNAALNMLAEWSGCKPRTGLNVLNAFANGSKVSMVMLRELIGYLDIKDVLPLLSSLSGSLTFGLHYISEMSVDSSLISIVTECITVKSGHPSYKFKYEDTAVIKEQLKDVSVEQLVRFLYGITKQEKLSRTCIINAYINAHNSMELLTKENTHDMLAIEDAQRADAVLSIKQDSQSKAPTLEDLFRDAKIIE